jgi:hypothetical protein
MDVGDRFTGHDGKLYEIVGHYSMSYKTQLVSEETDKPVGEVFSMIPPATDNKVNAPVVDINFRFRVIDQEQLQESLEHLEEQGFHAATKGTFAQKVESVVCNLDVLALSPSGEQQPLGWNDVGLERITR